MLVSVMVQYMGSSGVCMYSICTIEYLVQTVADQEQLSLD
jgi:hypothetical protein